LILDLSRFLTPNRLGGLPPNQQKARTARRPLRPENA
jgi:hypothetical protein